MNRPENDRNNTQIAVSPNRIGQRDLSHLEKTAEYNQSPSQRKAPIYAINSKVNSPLKISDEHNVSAMDQDQFHANKALEVVQR